MNECTFIEIKFGNGMEPQQEHIFNTVVINRSSIINYHVDGQLYEGFKIYKRGIKEKNGRYYVKFGIDNPEKSEIFYNYEVPNDIKATPPTGWETMPKYWETLVEL